MTPLELRVTYPDLASLARELEGNLVHGRAFLPQVATAQVLSDCVLVLEHPVHGAELRLSAQIVMVCPTGAMVGTGIELRPFGPATVEQMRAFLVSSAAEAPEAEAEAEPLEPNVSPNNDVERDDAARDDAEGDDSDTADFEESELVADDLEASQEHDDASSHASAHPSEPRDVQAQSRQEKLRGLNPMEQAKLARTGELGDRVALERLYGKQVWDALLHNPRLTPPEVARIARKGTVPKPLLELILENASWIKTPEVRRALLSNPKVSSDSVLKLLRATPKHELKLIEKGTAYAPPIRETARKLLKQ